MNVPLALQSQLVQNEELLFVLVVLFVLHRARSLRSLKCCSSSASTLESWTSQEDSVSSVTYHSPELASISDLDPSISGLPANRESQPPFLPPHQLQYTNHPLLIQRWLPHIYSVPVTMLRIMGEKVLSLLSWGSSGKGSSF